MRRTITVKRSVGFAAAALVVGTVGALSMPALASTTDSYRAEGVPSITLDFTGTNDEGAVANAVGANFGGTGRVKDTHGAVIGTAYDQCDKDSVKPTSTEAFCTGMVKLDDGAQLAFTTTFPIPNTASSYPQRFEGVITGGTRHYEGTSGEAHFVARSAGIYDLNFS